jgi:hypothetical protein
MNQLFHIIIFKSEALLRKLALFALIIIVVLLKNDFCSGQDVYGWKIVLEFETSREYLDTLNIHTYNNKTFFYLKEEYPDTDFKKRNIGWPDSSYMLYYVDTINPSICLISQVDFHKNGNVMLSMSESGKPLGPDLFNYGIGNLKFENYYHLVTGKSLIALWRGKNN